MKSTRASTFDLFRYLRIPHFLEMPAIGIDISDSAVRYIELVKDGAYFIPCRYGEKRLNPGVVVSGAIIKKDELVQVLASIAKEEKYHFVKASLPEAKAYVFNVSIPELPEADIPEALTFRIEDNAPISAAEAIFDYTVIGKNEKGELDLSVTAVPESVVKEYIDIYQKAGFTPRSFELESRAIARALVERDDSRTYLIVHIGENKTVFSIVRAGVVRFTSTMYIGSKNLDVAVEQSFAPIKDEINKLGIYWFTHKTPGTPGIQKIDEVLLSGKNAMIAGVLDYISRNVKIPVKIANPWATSFSYDSFIPTLSAEEALNYVTVIGLSLPKKSHA